MRKSLVPARCPRLWQELARGRKVGSGRAVTVLLQNVSSLPTRSLLEGRNPSYGLSDGAKWGERVGDACVSSWSMRLVCGRSLRARRWLVVEYLAVRWSPGRSAMARVENP